jgi:hypothetical protein
MGQGTSGTCSPSGGGFGGSGGTNGVLAALGVVGGLYGGGGPSSCFNTARGGSGAVRIIWPGNTRTFPSTCAGSP